MEEPVFVEDELRLAQEGVRNPDCSELYIEKQSYIPSITWFQSNFQNLRVLNISWCGLEDLSGIAGPIKGTFDGFGLPNLEELYASYNRVVKLSALRGHKKLEVLDLEGNNVSDEKELTVLNSIPTLQVLNFLYNPITERKDVYNIPVLKKYCPSLTTLDDVDVTAIKGVGGGALRMIRALRDNTLTQPTE